MAASRIADLKKELVGEDSDKLDHFFADLPAPQQIRALNLLKYYLEEQKLLPASGNLAQIRANNLITNTCPITLDLLESLFPIKDSDFTDKAPFVSTGFFKKLNQVLATDGVGGVYSRSYGDTVYKAGMNSPYRSPVADFNITNLDIVFLKKIRTETPKQILVLEKLLQDYPILLTLPESWEPKQINQLVQLLSQHQALDLLKNPDFLRLLQTSEPTIIESLSQLAPDFTLLINPALQHLGLQFGHQRISALCNKISIALLFKIYPELTDLDETAIQQLEQLSTDEIKILSIAIDSIKIDPKKLLSALNNSAFLLELIFIHPELALIYFQHNLHLSKVAKEHLETFVTLLLPQLKQNEVLALAEQLPELASLQDIANHIKDEIRHLCYGTTESTPLSLEQVGSLQKLKAYATSTDLLANITTIIKMYAQSSLELDQETGKWKKKSFSLTNSDRAIVVNDLLACLTEDASLALHKLKQYIATHQKEIGYPSSPTPTNPPKHLYHFCDMVLNRLKDFNAQVELAFEDPRIVAETLLDESIRNKLTPIQWHAMLKRQPRLLAGIFLQLGLNISITINGSSLEINDYQRIAASEDPHTELSRIIDNKNQHLPADAVFPGLNEFSMSAQKEDKYQLTDLDISAGFDYLINTYLAPYVDSTQPTAATPVAVTPPVCLIPYPVRIKDDPFVRPGQLDMVAEGAKTALLHPQSGGVKRLTTGIIHVSGNHYLSFISYLDVLGNLQIITIDPAAQFTKTNDSKESTRQAIASYFRKIMPGITITVNDANIAQQLDNRSCGYVSLRTIEDVLRGLQGQPAVTVSPSDKLELHADQLTIHESVYGDKDQLCYYRSDLFNQTRKTRQAYDQMFLATNTVTNYSLNGSLGYTPVLTLDFDFSANRQAQNIQDEVDDLYSELAAILLASNVTAKFSEQFSATLRYPSEEELLQTAKQTLDALSNDEIFSQRIEYIQKHVPHMELRIAQMIRNNLETDIKNLLRHHITKQIKQHSDCSNLTPEAIVAELLTSEVGVYHDILLRLPEKDREEIVLHTHQLASERIHSDKTKIAINCIYEFMLHQIKRMLLQDNTPTSDITKQVESFCLTELDDWLSTNYRYLKTHEPRLLDHRVQIALFAVSDEITLHIANILREQIKTLPAENLTELLDLPPEELAQYLYNFLPHDQYPSLNNFIGNILINQFTRLAQPSLESVYTHTRHDISQAVILSYVTSEDTENHMVVGIQRNESDSITSLSFQKFKQDTLRHIESETNNRYKMILNQLNQYKKQLTELRGLTKQPNLSGPQGLFALSLQQLDNILIHLTKIDRYTLEQTENLFSSALHQAEQCVLNCYANLIKQFPDNEMAAANLLQQLSNNLGFTYKIPYLTIDKKSQKFLQKYYGEIIEDILEKNNQHDHRNRYDALLPTQEGYRTSSDLLTPNADRLTVDWLSTKLRDLLPDLTTEPELSACLSSLLEFHQDELLSRTHPACISLSFALEKRWERIANTTQCYTQNHSGINPLLLQLSNTLAKNQLIEREGSALTSYQILMPNLRNGTCLSGEPLESLPLSAYVLHENYLISLEEIWQQQMLATNTNDAFVNPYTRKPFPAIISQQALQDSKIAAQMKIQQNIDAIQAGASRNPRLLANFLKLVKELIAKTVFSSGLSYRFDAGDGSASKLAYEQFIQNFSKFSRKQQECLNAIKILVPNASTKYRTFGDVFQSAISNSTCITELGKYFVKLVYDIEGVVNVSDIGYWPLQFGWKREIHTLPTNAAATNDQTQHKQLSALQLGATALRIINYYLNNASGQQTADYLGVPHHEISTLTPPFATFMKTISTILATSQDEDQKKSAIVDAIRRLPKARNESEKLLINSLKQLIEIPHHFDATQTVDRKIIYAAMSATEAEAYVKQSAKDSLQQPAIDYLTYAGHRIIVKTNPEKVKAALNLITQVAEIAKDPRITYLEMRTRVSILVSTYQRQAVLQQKHFGVMLRDMEELARPKPSQG